ncbi:MAG: helix-turn-helix transcriptional regulator [Pyramidobacter sp.]|nr:helix-turn-helix transcriptional regulator [Pyramidobacter sp.]
MKSNNSIQFSVTLGERIKALRKAKKLSQDELSSILDCHKNTISAWENDRDTPDRFFVVAMANCFGCSADYLLGLSPVPQRADMPAPEVPATAAGRAFDELARQIAQKDPDALLLFAKPFSEAELEMLTGAFRSIAAHRAEVAAEVEAARATVPIDADPPLGVAHGKDKIG